MVRATDYFTKWVEAIPTRATTDSIIIKFLEENILAATDSVIIKFLKENILAGFGCPRKIIITDNSEAFNSPKLL
jgi:hypothetical protein